MPVIAIRCNGACNHASGQSIAISQTKFPGFHRPSHIKKGALPDFGRNR